MEAVYFGNSTEWGSGFGKGPHLLADLEQGLWPGGENFNGNNTPLNFPFVTAMVKGGSNGFGLKGQDATAGALKTMYDGPRPAGYQPMKKQGAIALGIGTFFVPFSPPTLKFKRLYFAHPPTLSL